MYDRDGGQCTFTDAGGNRCPARHRLELHHRGVPFARGGQHTVEGLALRCAAHNQLDAERVFGASHMERARSRRPRNAGAGGWGPGGQVDLFTHGAQNPPAPRVD